MCGLVGVLTKNKYGFNNKQQEIFSDLLLVDSLRGEDSTGVFVVCNDGDLELAKDKGHSANFLATTEFKALNSLAFRKGVAMIGHNRKATKGSITDQNAHPFVVDDNIVLVHNGTLYGDHKKHADVEVDSHAIAHLLHKHEGNVEAVLKEIDGAWALIWYDFKKQQLNFLRNDARPLHLLETDTEYIWASEFNMLKWMEIRHNLKPVERGIIQLASNNHSIFTWNNGWEIKDSVITVQTKYDSGWSKRGYSSQYFDNTMSDEYHLSYYGYNRQSLNDETLEIPRLGNNPTPPRVTPYDNQVAREEKLCKETMVLLRPGDSIKFCISLKEARLIRAIDYTFANGVDEKSGYLLYGFFLDEPDVLARMYIPSEVPEVDIMTVAIESKLVRATVNSFTHRAYNGATDIGYYVAFCSNPIFVEEKLVV